MAEIKTSKLAIYHTTGLNPDGTEKVDTTKISVGLKMGVMSADMKLKQMVQREIERAKERDETNLDAMDFELPQEESLLHHSVAINPMSVREFKEHYREQRKKWQQKVNERQEQTDGEEPAVRKPAQTGRAKRVENDNPRSAKQQASTEGADQEED